MGAKVGQQYKLQYLERQLAGMSKLQREKYGFELYNSLAELAASGAQTRETAAYNYKLKGYSTNSSNYQSSRAAFQQNTPQILNDSEDPLQGGSAQDPAYFNNPLFQPDGPFAGIADMARANRNMFNPGFITIPTTGETDVDHKRPEKPSDLPPGPRNVTFTEDGQKLINDLQPTVELPKQTPLFKIGKKKQEEQHGTELNALAEPFIPSLPSTSSQVDTVFDTPVESDTQPLLPEVRNGKPALH